jgi:spermidine synthase
MPESVLIVGFGAGVTAGTFVLYPTVRRIVICEIEPLIPQVIAQHFREENYNVLSDPRVEVVYDDARNYIHTTGETFDIITSDPIHPWVKGSASLYTREYFDLARRHLNPGGVISLWVPLYESTLDAVRSQIATFFDVFPNGTVWSNTIEGNGYDLVLMASERSSPVDLDLMTARLNKPEYLNARYSLQNVEFPNALSLFATYAGRARDLAGWLSGAEINRDNNLRLQYLAGLGLNDYQQTQIYSQMVSHRRFPEDLFVGSEDKRIQLRNALAADARTGQNQGSTSLR